MPSKVYSIVEKEQIKENLIKLAQQKYARYGIRNVRLEDLLKEVHISKPFFYKLFESVPYLIMEALQYQWILMYERIYKVANSNMEWKQQVHYFLHQLANHQASGIFIMTQEEETWVRKHVHDEVFKNFMMKQIDFFVVLQDTWKLNIEQCKPEVFANLLITMALIKNSATQSLPFLYLEDIEATTNAQIDSLVLYFESIKM